MTTRMGPTFEPNHGALERMGRRGGQKTSVYIIYLLHLDQVFLCLRSLDRFLSLSLDLSRPVELRSLCGELDGLPAHRSQLLAFSLSCTSWFARFPVTIVAALLFVLSVSALIFVLFYFNLIYLSIVFLLRSWPVDSNSVFFNDFILNKQVIVVAI